MTNHKLSKNVSLEKIISVVQQIPVSQTELTISALVHTTRKSLSY
jgi:hypothetical protein